MTFVQTPLFNLRYLDQAQIPSNHIVGNGPLGGHPHMLDTGSYCDPGNSWMDGNPSPSTPSSTSSWSAESPPPMTPSVSDSFQLKFASNIKVEASLISWPGDIYDNDRTMPMHCMSDDEVIDSATFPTEKLPYFFYAHPTGITTNGIPVHLGNSPRFPLFSFDNNDPNPTINPHNDYTEDVKPDLQSHAYDIAIPAVVNPEHDIIDGDHMKAENPSTSLQDVSAMRTRMLAIASRRMEGTLLRKTFSKQPKEVVATPNTLRASVLRRKHEPKFFCHISGCKGNFTRKHNLENHLKSHMGVTELFCPKCGKEFTTIPVHKRHIRGCHKTTARTKRETSKPS